jgi:hypothetical protein
MGWFTKGCRNAGLMIHHLVNPPPQEHKQTISHKVEEEKVNETITLRRTTIEEVEVSSSDETTKRRSDEGTKGRIPNWEPEAPNPDSGLPP